MFMKRPRRRDLAAGTPVSGRRPARRALCARLLAGTIVAAATLAITPKAWVQG